MNLRLLLMLYCVMNALLPTLQAAAGDTVELRIETVLASDSSQEFDDRLTDSRNQWKNFRYSSYQLVQEERRHVGWGKRADFFLPGGRLLQVVPKEQNNNRISLQVMLMEGTTPTPLMSTSLLIPNHGTLFVGGRKHQEGTLIIRIGAIADE
ncbi:MAG: hypothetical protein ACRERD_26330 [Candidatus Binatia bacterium]